MGILVCPQMASSGPPSERLGVQFRPIGHASSTGSPPWHARFAGGVGNGVSASTPRGWFGGLVRLEGDLGAGAVSADRPVRTSVSELRFCKLPAEH